MAQQFQAAPIQARTKGELKQLRRNGYIPVSIQHRGQETLHLQEEARPLEEYIRQHGTSNLLELVIAPENRRQTVMVHDVQRHPITQRLMQVTFQRVERNEPIKARVPVVLHGEPEAVRLHTAVVQAQATEIEIRCLPRDLPDHITVDISHLGFNDLLRVGDLPKNDHYEILTSPDTVLVSLVSLAAKVAEEEEIEAAAPATEAAAETAGEGAG
ncbi:MAG TPA: 50S ribosomal protein L25 [Chthonomonadaceae bacterium]|nr:50S ribosomal protein L25 [Chthonomonadaceae bacterium]